MNKPEWVREARPPGQPESFVVPGHGVIREGELRRDVGAYSNGGSVTAHTGNSGRGDSMSETRSRGPIGYRADYSALPGDYLTRSNPGGNYPTRDDFQRITEQRTTEERGSTSRLDQYLDIHPKVAGMGVGSLLAIAIESFVAHFGIVLDPLEALVYGSLLAGFFAWLAPPEGRSSETKGGGGN